MKQCWILLAVLAAALPLRGENLRESWQETHDATIRFWSSPAVIEPAGGYHAWFDAAKKRIAPPRADDNQPLYLQLRILYLNALGFRQAVTPAEQARCQEQYRHGFRYLQQYRDPAGSGLFRTPVAAGAVRPQLQASSQLIGLYMLSEAARATGDPAAAEWAWQLFELLQRDFHDPVHGGYFEFPGRSGRKNVGTLIHSLPALSALQKIHPHPAIQRQIAETLRLIQSGRLLRPDGGAYQEMTGDWQAVARERLLYGHNAQLVWFYLEAVREQGLSPTTSLELAERAAAPVLQHGILPDGTVVTWGGVDDARPVMTETTVWWTQLEVMNMLAALYRASGKIEYRETLRRVARRGAELYREADGLWQLSPPGQRRYFGGHTWKSGMHTVRAMRFLLDAVPDSVW